MPYTIKHNLKCKQQTRQTQAKRKRAERVRKEKEALANDPSQTIAVGTLEMLEDSSDDDTDNTVDSPQDTNADNSTGDKETTVTQPTTEKTSNGQNFSNFVVVRVRLNLFRWFVFGVGRMAHQIKKVYQKFLVQHPKALKQSFHGWENAQKL